MRERGVHSRVIYLSDTAAVPYGRMAASALRERVHLATRFLRDRGATHLVVACNAASTVLHGKAWVLPIVGMIDPALNTLRSLRPQCVGVLGGGRTIRSGLFRRHLRERGHHVIQRIAQPLSGHIERGSIGGETARMDLIKILRPLHSVDLVVLACTHYPAIAERLQTELPGVQLFDPSHAVAGVVSAWLPATHGGDAFEALCTGDPAATRSAAIRTWSFDPGRCSRVDLG
jgi:glutamate racemase